MKISTNKLELTELDVFSEYLESNGWDDTWRAISSVCEQLSQGQKDDLSLLACDWAERSLVHFESQFPNDDRPRKAIEAKRSFIKGEISEKELEKAQAAARAAGAAAWAAAQAAAWAAAWAAAAAAAEAVATAVLAEEVARAAVWSAWAAEEAAVLAEAAWDAAMKKMQDELMGLFLKWESKK